MFHSTLVMNTVCGVLLLILLICMVYNYIIMSAAKNMTAAFQQAENQGIVCQLVSPRNKLGPIVDNWQTFQAHTALVLGDLIGRVAHAAHSATALSSPPNFRILDTYQTPISTCVWESNANLYIIFRGTMTQDEWYCDLQTQQSVYSLDLEDSLKPEASVHYGFLKVYQSIQAEICAQISDHALHAKNIFIAGYSLGAALATFLSLDLYRILPSKFPLVLYTFASPRVGNHTFADLINNNITVFRVVNQADMVTDLPLVVMPNCDHSKEPYYYQHVGTPILFFENMGSWKQNHHLNTYLFPLEQNTDLMTCVRLGGVKHE